MKKLNYKLLVIAGMALMLTACEKDFLDKPIYGVLAADDYYKNDTELEEGVFAIYDAIQWTYATDWNSMFVVKSFPSDETHAGGGDQADQPPYQQLDDFSYTSENKPIEHTFQGLYFAIMRANVIINTAVGDTPARAHMIAEAKALRAYCYFELVSMFGGVPIRLTQTKGTDFAMAKSTPEQVYAQIHKDLDEAIPNLPKKSEYAPAMRFRMAQGAAWALKGKAFLFQKKYAESAKAFDEIIKSGQYSLAPDYSKLFLKEQEYGVESLFEIGYSETTKNDWGNFQWGGNRAMENQINWQLMGPRDTKFEGGTSGLSKGWGFNYPTAKIAQAYEAEGDVVRENASILSVAQLKAKGGDWLAAPGEQWGMDGYFRLKYGTLVSETSAPGAGTPELNYGTNIRIIRYADVLLMAAEANFLSNNVGVAQGYLDQVRNRVNLPAKVITMDAIKTERKLELAFEGFRFLDLIRWGDAAAVLKNQGFSKNGNFLEKHNLFPIPYSEVKNNKLMVQNPGW
ncbi:RagB/SusD family nutrient uptake outer membrane protein [Flavobacterium sp.]|uniref:RagB/SusD family nutrient uptake outer membrane protein n=1 Tax=Flavobacterium sp. TaxID=239 RepID=UPI002BA1045A|nr:RagB/SusD family nutrient uptake outer membrane protein [Flavobacterium sp.]HSD06854.1 RagB/SusD family nutrient uptake outer membrane protein [Flavobacterium sp.]